MQTDWKIFISVILSYKISKNIVFLRCTAKQVGTGHKVYFQPKNPARAKLAVINNKNVCGTAEVWCRLFWSVLYHWYYHIRSGKRGFFSFSFWAHHSPYDWLLCSSVSFISFWRTCSIAKHLTICLATPACAAIFLKIFSQIPDKVDLTSPRDLLILFPHIRLVAFWRLIEN